MKKKLVDAALRIVDRKKGLRGVSLRSIATEAGCSHANAYNYFSGLEELFWLAVEEGMRRLMAFCDDRYECRRRGESAIEALVAGQYEFAFKHEGIYRMIWLEPPRGKSTPGAERLILQGAWTFSAKVAEALGEAAETPKTIETAQILHSYIHGQVAKLLSGRIPDPAKRIQASMAQAFRLVEALRALPDSDSYQGWIERPAITRP